MKKFMIFLLMAVLYLGTCQARSEATHFINANSSLHGWVTPAAQSLFMDLTSMDAVDVVITPSQPQSIALNGSTTSASYSVVVSGLPAGETIIEYQWLVDGTPIDGTNTTTFTIPTLPVGNHQISCRVKTSMDNTYTSAPVSLMVAADIAVNIVGPDHACQNDIITLTAVVDNDQIGHTYHWRLNGNYIVGANGASYSFNVADLPNLDQNLVYEFDVEISRDGCEAVYSPVHYFTVSPTPVVYIENPMFCAGTTGTITANAYTSGSEQPYKWIWHKQGVATTDITYVNTYNVTASGVYSVEAVYQDFACNSMSRNTNVKTYEDSLAATLADLTLGSDVESNCVGGQVILTLTDPNTNPVLGTPVYTWYLNGQLLNGVNNLVYRHTLNNLGAYNFRVVASYPGYPCATKEAQVSVNAVAAPEMVNITGSNVLCVGNTAALTANHDNGTYTYVWNNGMNTKTVNVEAGIYTVTVSNGACQTVSEPFTVWGFGSDFQLSQSESTVCAGQSVTLNANEENWPGNVTYAWSDGTNNLGNNNFVIVNPTTTTTYTVTATLATNSSAAQNCTVTRNFVVNVPAAPTTLTVTVPEAVCVGAQFTVSTSAVDGMTYTWYENGFELEGQNLATITMARPAGTYSYAVAVNSADGCQSAVSTAAQMTVKPAPEMVNITGSNVLCVGSTVALTANHDNGTYTYAWNNGMDTKTVNVEAGVYTVTVSNGECQTVSEPFTVWGFGSDLQLSQSESTVCAGQSVTLNANEENWPGNVTYEWSDGSTNNFLVVAPTVTTTYSVTATLQGMNTASGDCTIDRMFKVTVFGSPIAPVVTVPAEAVCAGAQFTVSTPAVDGMTYTWYENGFELEGQNLATITMARPAGTYSYAVAITNANGCQSAMSTTDAIVTVNADPAFVNITGVNVICVGEEANLTVNTDAADPADYTYAWSNGLTTNVVNVEAGVYTVTVSNGACQTVSEPFTVWSFAADFQITASATEVCSGSAVTLNANEENWTGNVEYEWSQNGAILGNNNNVVVNPTTTTEYTVVATLTSHANPANAGCQVTRAYTVNVNEIPEAPVIVNATGNIACEGAQFTLNVETAVPGYLYTWYENGIEIEGENLYTIGITRPAGNYWYNVAVTSDKGCKSPVSEQRDMQVIPNPTVEISGDAMICDTSSMKLNLFANVNDNALTPGTLTYQWRESNITLLETTNNLVIDDISARDEAYIYTVRISNGNGCVAESDPYYVYVGANPTVAVTLDHDTVCLGGEVTATAHLGDYNMDGITYQWSEIVGTDTVVVAHGTSANYTTTVTADQTTLHVHIFQNGTECTADGKATATVITPLVTKSVVAINDGNVAKNVCEGAEIVVTAFIEDAAGNLVPDTLHDYVWKENGFLMPLVTGCSFNKQLTIVDEDMTHYIYTAYINYGMPGCEAVPVSSDTIEVKRNPIVEIEGVHHICYQGVNEPNVHLTAWVDGQVDVDATYNWYKNGMLTHNYLTYGNLYNEMLEPSYMDPYYFKVEVINGDGCSTISEPFEVNVHAVPAVNVTANIDSICLGGEAILRANLDNYNDTMLTFQWYRDQLNAAHVMPGYTHETQVFHPAQTTNYIVEVIHLLNDNTNDHSICAAYDTLTVNVFNDPVITNLEVNLPAGNNICEGGEFTLTATIDGGVQGGEVFTWYRNGEVIANANQATLTESPVTIDGNVTNYVYSVSVRQTASGCESNISVDSITVTVNPNPTLAIQTDPIVCVETADNIVMVANVDPVPATEYSFRWFEDNAVIAGETGAMITLTKPYRDYAYNFSVELVNAYGCTNTAETHVYVNAAPVVNITATETQICIGGEITLTADLNDWNADQLVYQWYDNGNLIAGATSLTYTVVPTQGNHDYTFTVNQLTSGCTASSNTVSVTVNDIPVISSIDSDLPASNNICEGRQVIMTANVQGGVTGGEVFTWYRNGSVIEGATEATLIEAPVAVDGDPTTYVYTVAVAQTAAGCVSAISTDNITFTVNANPTLAIETDPIVCNDAQGNIVMTAHVYPEPTTAYTFNWFEDNAIIAGENAATITLTKPYRDYAYNFSVSLVNQYGCETSASTVVYVNDEPVVNIVATETEICEGGEITLTANLNDWNADQLTYQWFDNGTEIAGATSLTYTVVPTLGQHQYTFAVHQLTSLCDATSNTVIVNVHEIPVIDEVVLSDYNVCEGAQLTVTAVLADQPQVGEVYTWYRNGVLIEGATARTIQDSPVTVDNNAQQFTYTAVVTRLAAGCTSLPTTSAAVTVYPNPTVVIAGDQHVCETDSVFLIANVDTIGHNVGNLHYTWYESGQVRDNMAYGLGDSQFFAEYLYARDEPYRFVVEVQREGVAAGCASRSQEYNVYVYRQPVVNITATETEICENGQVTLTANLNDYNADNMVYQWYEVRTRREINAIGYDDAGHYIFDTVMISYNYNIPGATSASYTTTLAETTVLGVRVEQTLSTCWDNDEITITVHPIPVITNVTVNGLAEITVCDGAQVTVAATIDAYNEEGAVYTWYRNGELIEGATQATFSENVYTTTNHVTTNTYTAIVTLPASGCESILSTMAGVVSINPAPSVVSISGNNVICENDSTILTAYSDVQGTFVWSNGQTGVDHITVPAGEYTVTLITPEGCERTSEPFTVEALGTDLFVTASETAICEGEHTTLYANQQGWAGNVTYQWDAQANNSTSTTVDVQPDTTTTYHVIATVNSTNGSCSAEGTITIVVTPRPEQVVVTANASAICEGEQVSFHASGNAYSYIWYNNGIVIPGENQENITLNFFEEGQYAISAKAVNDQGCESAEASEPVVITVNAAPESVVISGVTEICDGGSTTLYANVTPSVNATDVVVYTWFFNNNVIADANNASLVVTESGSYKVEVSVNGCSTISEAVDVMIQETPQLQLTATETTICAGGTTVISAEATGWDNGNVNYNWSNGFHGSVFTFTPAAAGDYTFYVTASQSTAGCTAVDSITIHVMAIPETPVLTLNHTVICDGGQVILTVGNDYSQYGNATYQWYRNGQLIAGATQATYSESPIAIDNDLTVYNYNAIVSFPASGCVSEVSADSTVYVIPAPVVSITFNGNSNLCEGGQVSMTANVTPAVNGYTYQWYKDNVLVPGATAATFVDTPVARETGYDYSVVVTANAGCIETAHAPALVNVVADPVVTATVDHAILCQGGTATFTAHVEDGVGNTNGLGRYTYAWFSSMSPNVAIGTEPTYTTNGTEAAGEYEYWVVVSSIYGCETQSANVHYSVVADPQVSIAVAQGFDVTVCDGGQTTLIANVTGGYGQASYQWYKNGLPMYGQTNVTLVTDPIVYGNDDNNTYTVIVRQTGVDCESTSTAYTVNVVPSYDVTVSGAANVCVGGQVTLTANVANLIAGDPVTYQWYLMSNGIETAINGANAAQYTTSNLLNPGNYEYYVTVNSNISGCSFNTSSSVTANVVADPTVTIAAAGNRVVVCEQGDIHLNAVVDGGVNGAAYTYTWTWFGAATGSVTTATPEYVVSLPANDPANPYFFQVSINRNDATGCTAVSEAIELNFVAVPVVTVSADRDYICAGGQVTFTANVAVGANNDYDYAWVINGLAQSTNNNTVTYTMPAVGAVTATVTVSRPGTTACSTTQTIAVPVMAVADPVVTIAADHLTMCAGGTTTLTSNVVLDNNIPANYTYQWSLNGFAVEGATNSTFVQPFNAAGTYVYTLQVTQTDNLGCTSAFSAPVTIQVAEQPVVELNSDYGLNICEGGQIALTGVVTNFGNTVNGVLNNTIYGTMNYNWLSQGSTVHTNNSALAQNQIIETLNTVGNYNYQVIVTPSGYACQPAASNIVTVGVVSDPSWTDVHVYYPDVCIGQDVILEAGIQGGVVDAAGSTNGHVQWTVTFNGVTADVAGGMGNTSYDRPAQAGTYVYTPTWVGNIGNGCAFTNTAAVQTTVEVHALPTAAFTSGDGTVICANVSDASAELTITFTGTAPFTFQLQDLETGYVFPVQVSGTNVYTINVTPDHTTQYRILMVQDAYCENGELNNADAIATIFVNDIRFEQNMFISGCADNGMVTINFNMISGQPNSEFVVTYENGEVYTGTIFNNTATFQAPTQPGDYNAVFSVDGCNYDIVVRVLVSEFAFGGEYPIIDQRWHDVVVVNNNPEINGGHVFVGFQWYKNGVLIPGATYSNYQELGGLNGFYSVELIEQAADGSMVTYVTCDAYFTNGTQVKVYPVPANVNQEVTIELDLTAEELEGASIDIFDVTGQLVQHVTNVMPITKVSGFHAQGTYFGRILTGTNEIKTVKFIIVK